MIVVLQPGALPPEIETIEEKLRELGCEFFTTRNTQRTMLHITGSEAHRAPSTLELLPGIARVVSVTSPYKLASREVQTEKSIIDLGEGLTIGGDKIIVMAGPCAVENEETLFRTAEKVAAAGAGVLRGGGIQTPHLSLQLSRACRKRSAALGCSPGKNRS